MRKDPTLKRDDGGIKSEKVVAAKHGRLGRTLQAQTLLQARSVSILKLPTPGLPGTTWIYPPVIKHGQLGNPLEKIGIQMGTHL